MAWREGPLGGSVADTKIVIPESTADPANDLSEDNPKLYHAEIDCTLNPGEDTYTRFFASEAATVGTDDATLVLWGIKGRILTYDLIVIASQAWTGVNFTPGLSVATVTNRGGTGGADSPTGIVKVTLLLAKGTV